jgi:glycosyltransferase involved in cell wall biosynthesis
VNAVSDWTIFIDANPLADRRLTGIGRYTARLALALRAQAPVRFFAGDLSLKPAPGLSWDPDQDLERWAQRVWRSRREPLGDPGPRSLAVYGCLRPEERRFAREVSILHDFTPLVVPGTHTPRTRGLFQGFFAKTLLASDAALAVSHSTRHDASWLCDFPQEKIAVCHSGPSICVERHLYRAPIDRRRNVGLVVSTLEPRKNAHFLLDWFKSTDALPRGTELWWVGRVGWLTSRRRLREYRRLEGRRVRFLGVVPDEALCRLYRTAGFSIYPSLYEGFGFPVLDSLRHGTPVLAGYHSALCEFDVPGVHYFDPCDAASLDSAWLGFAGNPGEIATLDKLSVRYDWRRVARMIVAIAEGRADDGLPAEYRVRAA